MTDRTDKSMLTQTHYERAKADYVPDVRGGGAGEAERAAIRELVLSGGHLLDAPEDRAFQVWEGQS